jgi:hypothetical protein
MNAVASKAATSSCFTFEHGGCLADPRRGTQQLTGSTKVPAIPASALKAGQYQKMITRAHVCRKTTNMSPRQHRWHTLIGQWIPTIEHVAELKILPTFSVGGTRTILGGKKLAEKL